MTTPSHTARRLALFLNRDMLSAIWQRVTVEALAEMFGVSRNTLHRDLADMDTLSAEVAQATSILHQAATGEVSRERIPRND